MYVVKDEGLFDEPTTRKGDNTLLLKLLIVAVVILILACIGLIIALIIRENLRARETPCMNKACVEAANRIQQSIDTSENPCNNFYRFACNGWEKQNIIPEESASLTRFDVLDDEVIVVIKNLLEQPENERDIPTTRMCKRFYNSCMNRSPNEQRGIQTLRAIAEAVGGLPIITANYDVNSKDIEEIYSYGSLYTLLILNPFLFNYDVDAKNSTRKLLQFDQPLSLDLPSFDMYKDPQKYSAEINAYKTLLTNYLRLLQVDFNVTLTNVTNIVERFISFQTKIAEASVASALRRDVNDVYNLTTLEDIEINFPQFKWRDFVNRVFNKSGTVITLLKNQPINLASYSFFEKLKDTLFTIDAKEAVSYMHLFSALNNVISHLPNAYRKVYSEFRKVVYDTVNETPRFKECHFLLNDLLGHAVGRMFIDSNFPEESKIESLSMIKMLNNAFESLIDDNLWMNSDTKMAAKEKLRLIGNNIGYPDWTKDDTKLTEFYKNLSLKNESYVIEYLVDIYKWVSSQYFSKFNQPNDKNDWIISAAVVNAYYQPSYNTINFPAAILQPPFFHKNYTRYLNFGAIGMVIGHEITHGFDDQGRQYDGYGNVRQWWNPTVVHKFKEKVQCLINQYGNFTAPNGMKLNGVQTQGENIADNGGIKQTFKAYREWVRQNGKEEATLPGLNFTPNQLLFINFASIWCHKASLSAWSNSILTNEHSPGTFRVIGSLQNLPEFQIAFNCQKKDYMNKEDKCNVW